MGRGWGWCDRMLRCVGLSVGSSIELSDLVYIALAFLLITDWLRLIGVDGPSQCFDELSVA